MILICDKERTSRALNFRNRLRKLGCPCAAAAISEIRDFLPIRMIVTYCDVFDDVRRTPYEDIFALVIGSGFVNTALNARRTDGEDSAVEGIRQILYQRNGIQDSRILPSGIFANDRLFLAERFFEVRGTMVCPTETEYLIYKYLFSCDGQYADAEKIAAFCCADPRASSGGNSVAVQIAHLNQKLESAYGKKPIRSRRYYGYYLEPIP